MEVERILFRGGTRDGQLTAAGEHPDTLVRIDDVETREAYARVEDDVTNDGVSVAVFRLDRDGELSGEAKSRFAPIGIIRSHGLQRVVRRAQRALRDALEGLITVVPQFVDFLRELVHCCQPRVTIGRRSVGTEWRVGLFRNGSGFLGTDRAERRGRVPRVVTT